MDQRLYDAVAFAPVIAAVKDTEGLDECLTRENIQVVFLLFGDVCSVVELVDRIKRAGKMAFVHADLISGLSATKEIAVDYIKAATRADGIISTKPNFIRRGRELGLFTVLRVFVIDSMALSGLAKLEQVRPDFLEILPGVMPKVICKICQIVRTPVLAGGLIADKEDVLNALNAGALAVSATSAEVWKL